MAQLVETAVNSADDEITTQRVTFIALYEFALRLYPAKLAANS